MKRVFRPGVFDLLHIGHINCIQHAAKLGDYLIVGVHDDREVLKQKGKEPIYKLSDRMAMLSQVKNVDMVISYKNTNISKLLNYLDIDILAVGSDYGQLPEQKEVIEYCNNNGIIIDYLNRTEGISSTIIAGKKQFWESRARKGLPTTLTSFKGEQTKIDEQTEKELNILLNHVNSDSNILDLGCGDGRLTIPLSKYCKSIKAIDFSKTYVNAIRMKQIPNIQIECIDASQYLDTASYDVIIISGLFPCLNDIQLLTIFHRVRMMLAPNGILAIRTTVSKTKRFDLINMYSEELNDLYTAHYRLQSEYMNIGENNGFYFFFNQELYSNHEDTSVVMLIGKEKDSDYLTDLQLLSQ